MRLRAERRAEPATREPAAAAPEQVQLVRDALAEAPVAVPSAVREEFEVRFGRGLSDVEIHAGPRANAAARALDARAFAIGRHVVFADGAYAPDTVEGRMLLAHEVAHALQSGLAEAPPALDPATPLVAPAPLAAPEALDPRVGDAPLLGEAVELAPADREDAAREAGALAASSRSVPEGVLDGSAGAEIARWPATMAVRESVAPLANPLVEQLALDVAEALERTPEDPTGRTRRRLGRMPEATRAAVVGRVQELLSPTQRERAAPALSGAAIGAQAPEAPAAGTAAEESAADAERRARAVRAEEERRAAEERSRTEAAREAAAAEKAQAAPSAAAPAAAPAPGAPAPAAPAPGVAADATAEGAAPAPAAAAAPAEGAAPAAAAPDATAAAATPAEGAAAPAGARGRPGRGGRSGGGGHRRWRRRGRRHRPGRRGRRRGHGPDRRGPAGRRAARDRARAGGGGAGAGRERSGGGDRATRRPGAARRKRRRPPAARAAPPCGRRAASREPGSRRRPARGGAAFERPEAPTRRRRDAPPLRRPSARPGAAGAAVAPADAGASELARAEAAEQSDITARPATWPRQTARPRRTVSRLWRRRPSRSLCPPRRNCPPTPAELSLAASRRTTGHGRGPRRDRRGRQTRAAAPATPLDAGVPASTQGSRRRQARPLP